MIESMTLEPLGMELEISDFTNDTRDTVVRLYYDKQSGIGKFCRDSPSHDIDSPDNIKTVIVHIDNKKYVFSNGALYDIGVVKTMKDGRPIGTDLRLVELHVDDLVSTEYLTI